MLRQPVLLILTASLLFPRLSFSLDTREVYKIAEPSVVVVLASDTKGEKNSLGSGVIVAPLEIVTSCKVLSPGGDIVVTQGSALRKAKLRFQDSERDLCQLHIEDPFPAGVVAAKPAVTAAEAGQELYAIGSPRGMERTITRAMVSGVRDVPGSRSRLIQVDMSVTGGTIGGGVFDQNAKLLGILVNQFRQSENAIYAAPVDWIAELPQRNADQIALAATAPAPAPQQPSGGKTDASAQSASSLHVGEKWKYKVSLGRQDVGNVTIEIAETRDKSVKELVRYDRSAGFTRNRDVDLGFDPIRFQPTVALPGGYQIIELAPYASPETQFVSGKIWNDIPGDFAPQGGSNTKASNSQVKIAGRETVRVPAGEFKAWKVESVSEQLYAVNQFFVARCTYWYAPEIKRTVKMNLYYKSPLDAISSSQTYELVSFEPGK